MQVPFDFAQGRLSTRFGAKTHQNSLRMTAYFLIAKDDIGIYVANI